MAPKPALRTGDERIASALELILADSGFDGPVTDLRRLTGGASRETWSFRVGHERAPRMILQRESPIEKRQRSLEREASVLRAAWATGVPVAEVVAAADRDSPLDAPFMITRFVDGEVRPRPILADPAFARVRGELGWRCGRTLARIHSIDPRATPTLAPHDPVAASRLELDEAGEPHPVFELAFRWLEATSRPSSSSRLVHGDFRLGNVVLGTDRIRAVLDWEHAHLGDPLEDLGWLCVKSWRFGGEEAVGGFGRIDDLLAGYEAESGFRPSDDAMRWWQVAGTLRWGIACVGQYRRTATGGGRSLELALIGRRAAECEHDLLRLLP